MIDKCISQIVVSAALVFATSAAAQVCLESAPESAPVVALKGLTQADLQLLVSTPMDWAWPRTATLSPRASSRAI